MRLFHRLTAALLCLGLIAGNAGICAGWAATAEERMACCEEGRNCPMHTRETDDSGSGEVLTQADADSCCLVSEGRKSSDTQVPPFAAALSFAVMGPGVVLPASVPALVLSNGWRTVSPIPTTPVPRHLLLSVFLV